MITDSDRDRFMKCVRIPVPLHKLIPTIIKALLELLPATSYHFCKRKGTENIEQVVTFEY